MTKDEALQWLRTKVSHNECEDCWYSCATLTCDEHRRSDKCDCGADDENAKREQIAALLQDGAALTEVVRTPHPHSAVHLLEAGLRDTERLEWFDKNADGVNYSGCGADDRWCELIYNDGNRVEGPTLRATIDKAMGPPDMNNGEEG
jgi:hypothetical protein